MDAEKSAMAGAALTSGSTSNSDAEAAGSRTPSAQLGSAGGIPALPAGWKYRVFGVGRRHRTWFASPPSQLLVVSLVCFLCPGMFNALTSIGGAGLDVKYVADNASIEHDIKLTTAIVGFFAGTVTNRLGVKASLSFGGIGYSIYIGFAYFAGAFLGVCAGLLWSAQGAVMMSYPDEAHKGRYISWFWVIFNLGAVIGGLIPLGENFHDTSTGPVSDGTYIGFLVLTVCGALLAWTLVDSRDVVRRDGSRVIVMKHPSWKTEILGLVETFRLEPYIILLFPMFWSSNWFYTYHFNTINGSKFNVRTRSLNSVLYWSAQMAGAGVFGVCLDINRFSRKTRALAAWVAIMVLTMAIWGGGYAWQRQYTREDLVNGTTKIYDWTSTGYVGPMFLYIVYGFYDAAFQTTVYWLMGALTNNGRRLANYAGFYKGIQSAGSAVSWRIDGQGVAFMAQFASCWALLGGSLVVALPLLLTRIRDHIDVEEDLKFSDETLSEVLPAEQVAAHRQSVDAGRDAEKI